MGETAENDIRNQGPPARILMVSGGTGGHIFPVLAVAEELRRRGGVAGRPYEIEFVGTRRPLEAKLIPAAGFCLHAVDSAGLKGIGGLRWLRNFLVLPRTAIEVALILKEFRPCVVVGIGGYLAGPVMMDAAIRDIPTVLIEPNARPGFTNRLLAPMVRAAAVGFAETAELYGTKAHITGLPVRRAFLNIPPRNSAQPLTVLIVGGSQGAKAMNREVPEGMSMLVRHLGKLRIIHQTGERDYNEVRRAYLERGAEAEVHAFIDDMPGMLAEADLVIARSGATTVAELSAAGRASVLVPFPGATDQHQLENARVMEKAGAARVIVQSELTPERLVAELRGLMASTGTLDKMAARARRLARPDAAERIADLVEGFARRS